LEITTMTDDMIAGELTLLAAIGIDGEGAKHPLGLLSAQRALIGLRGTWPIHI
jgi:hypothetical protein